jgi:hypothetical protein
LTPLTAALNAGSNMANASFIPAGQGLGGEWQYRNVPGGFGDSNPPTGFPVTQAYGIGSSGLTNGGTGLFDHGNFTPGPSDNVDGAGWGLVTSNYVDGTGPTDISNHPMERNSVVFTLNGWTLGDPGLLAGFGNIRFQYGTSLSEPFFPQPTPPTTPVPAGVVLLGMGGALTGLLAWRKRRQAKTA